MNEIFGAFPVHAMTGQLVGGVVLVLIGLLAGLSELFNRRASALKHIIESNDSNGGGGITTYRLYFGETSQFDIPPGAYRRMNLGNCYQVVYYPDQSVMQILGRAPAATVRGGPVTAIKENPTSQCR